MRIITVTSFALGMFALTANSACGVEAATPEGDVSQAKLNPLLLDQKPGTWLKLPIKSETKPHHIHGHAGVAIDPATSKLYFFGSDTHNQHWNNDVWSFDPVSMTWTQHYLPDDRKTYQYKDGYRSTTTGRPWCMHTFSSNSWDPIQSRLIVSARPVHYGLKMLPHVKMPKDAGDCWWEFEPLENKWYPIKDAPFPQLGQTTWLPNLKKIIAFNSTNTPIALYDPKEKKFEKLAFKGKRPAGYTLKTVYDPKRDRILLLSNDKEVKLWAYEVEKKTWTGLPTKDTPVGGIYGCWALDEAADCVVALYPEDPKGAFGNRSGKGVTWVCDLETNEWKTFKPEPSAPYYGMSFKMAYDARHKATLFVVRNVCWSFKAPIKDAKAGGK